MRESESSELPVWAIVLILALYAAGLGGGWWAMTAPQAREGTTADDTPMAVTPSVPESVGA